MEEITHNKIKGKRILVTGACGTIGSEVIHQLLHKYEPKEVLAMDNNESALFFLEQQYLHHDNLTLFLGDVRDRDKLCRMSEGVHIIIHAAAFKHVILCERSPFEAVQTNIIGVQNVIYAGYENNVERVLFTSSDKAVNPTNVMGTSKLMGERLMTAANNAKNKSPIFFSTRFGNVLGSSGSVLPIFRKQIKKGGPITLTDSEMTRFIMTVEEAVRLVLDTLQMAKGGEVFITKMPVIRIEDLAHAVIRELASTYGHSPEKIDIEIIGSKPGEKLYEELMSNEEMKRSFELKNYFVVLPAFRNLYPKIEFNYADLIRDEVEKPYLSSEEPSMTQYDLRIYLRRHNLI